MPEEKYGLRWPLGDAQTHRKRALLLWAQALESHSAETRAELEQLALLYERLAVRAARRAPAATVPPVTTVAAAATLGELVVDKTRPAVPESDWSALLRRIGAGEPLALETLCLWTHRFVSAFVMGITNDVFAAEELTVMLYQDVWLEAAGYDSGGDTVIAWLLNKARARALELSQFTYQPDGRSPRAMRASAEVLAVIEHARKLPELSGVRAIEDEPGMEERGAGIYAKVLASDSARGRLGMLVRLAPRAAYPPHVHAGIEQLYLLQGELWIDGRKLSPGDYNRAEQATADTHVWSATGCACILVTSGGDRLGAG